MKFNIGDIIYAKGMVEPDVYLITGVRSYNMGVRNELIYDIFHPYVIGNRFISHEHGLAYGVSQKHLDNIAIICPTLPMYHFLLMIY